MTKMEIHMMKSFMMERDVIPVAASCVNLLVALNAV
jgi:hypothetical protein